MMVARYPPGPKAWPLLQQIREASPRRLEALQSITRTYGDIAHVGVLGKHYYLLNHPEFIHAVLVGQASHFQSIPIGKRPTARSLKPEVVAADRDAHRQQRRLLQPAFTPTRVARYGGVMVEYANQLVERWMPGDLRDLVEDMTQLTLRIVARTLFDADVSDKADLFGEAITLGSEYISGGDRVPFFIPTRTNRKLIRAWFAINRTVSNVIAERRRSGIDKGDLLSAVLLAVDDENGSRLTEKQARETVLGLFIAGHETTANAMLWTWVQLAQNPAALRQLQAELDRVLAGRHPTAADLENLPYTGWVIRESMRLYPPAWGLTRSVFEPVTLGGYTLPRGSQVFLSPYLLHRDARFYPEPEAFRPERWADDFDKKLPPLAYFPFGGGAHICLGQFFASLEARLLLATIAQRIWLDLLPNQQIEIQPLITLRSAGPIRFRLQER